MELEFATDVFLAALITAFLRFQYKPINHVLEMTTAVAVAAYIAGFDNDVFMLELKLYYHFIRF
jgi:hypothetical protein